MAKKAKKREAARSTQWVKDQYARLDETRRLLDEAHARAGELLDEAYSFRAGLDATGIEFFQRIIEGEKGKLKRERSPLLGFAETILATHARGLEAEKLAVALGCCVIAQGKDLTAALRDLNKQFPDWKDTLEEWEASWDDDEDGPDK